MSRNVNYFENDPIVRSDWNSKHRTFVGQIESVDPSDGTVLVVVGAIRDSKRANLPMTGMFYDRENGPNSSWARYMPPVGAFVRLGYGPRNELEVLNYLTYGADPDAQGEGGSFDPRLGAYKALSRYAKNNTNLMRIWRTLKPGEFDLRSAGGAGYYFTSDGRAIVEAGSTALELDANRFETNLFSYANVMGGDGVELRFGNVKRPAIPGGPDEDVDPSPATSAGSKEWRVQVTSPTPGTYAPLRYLYEDHAGDIRDEVPPLNPPLNGPFGLPLRRRVRHFDPSGFLATLSVQVDVQGNIDVAQVPSATFGMQASFFKASVSAVTSMELNAGTTLDLGGTTGVNINAGGAADDGIVKGQALSTYLTTKLKVPTAWGLSGSAILPLTVGVEYSLLGKVK